MKTFTTGEIAKFCDVNTRTVIRWIEKGELTGFKLPGRGNNRIREEDLMNFLKANEIPIPEELAGDTVTQVLVVDDDPAVARSLRRVFKLHGYEATIVHDGFEAGVKLASIKPKLMTLDLNMPNVDGFDVLKFLRENEGYDDLKVIVISAMDDVFLEVAESCGADAALSKPYDTDQLLAVVSSLLGDE